MFITFCQRCGRQLGQTESTSMAIIGGIEREICDDCKSNLMNENLLLEG